MKIEEVEKVYGPVQIVNQIEEAAKNSDLLQDKEVIESYQTQQGTNLSMIEASGWEKLASLGI